MSAVSTFYAKTLKTNIVVQNGINYINLEPKHSMQMKFQGLILSARDSNTLNSR